MVSILKEMFMNIYIYIYIYKFFNPWLPYITKIKLKESRLKYFTCAWYTGKG